MTCPECIQGQMPDFDIEGNEIGMRDCPRCEGTGWWLEDKIVADNESLRNQAAALSRELEEAKGKTGYTSDYWFEQYEGQRKGRIEDVTRLSAELEEAKAERDEAKKQVAATQRAATRSAREIADEITTRFFPEDITEERLRSLVIAIAGPALRAAPRSEGSGDWLELLRLARDTVQASCAEDGVSDAIKSFRQDLYRRLNDFIREYKALAPRSETEGRDKERWRPIETAPRPEYPGKIVSHRILAYHDSWDMPVIVKWSPQRPAPHWTTDAGAVLNVEPSHWMPLPPPPALAHDEKGAGERQDQTYKELKEAARRMGEASRAGEIE